jgi:hypothetical protein
MSPSARPDPTPHLAAVAEALARPGQPDATFAALDRATAAAIGHKLFTVLLLHQAAGESERRYTNQPAAYPVGGRKKPNPGRWTRQVLEEKRPFIGYDAADISEVFGDHELIASLGCASVLNLPVLWEGRVLGTVNLLHEARWYAESDVAVGRLFAALAVPAYLAAAG